MADSASQAFYLHVAEGWSVVSFSKFPEQAFRQWILRLRRNIGNTGSRSGAQSFRMCRSSTYPGGIGAGIASLYEQYAGALEDVRAEMDKLKRKFRDRNEVSEI